MKKITLAGLTLLALSTLAPAHAEEKRYVSDELSTWVRSGPGDQFRLLGKLNAGEEVQLLQTNNDTHYGQIRDSEGRTTWIPLSQLSANPSLRTRVPQLEQQVKDLTAKLDNIDNSWNQRTAEMQNKVASSDGVDAVRRASAPPLSASFHNAGLRRGYAIPYPSVVAGCRRFQSRCWSAREQPDADAAEWRAVQPVSRPPVELQ